MDKWSWKELECMWNALMVQTLACIWKKNVLVGKWTVRTSLAKSKFSVELHEFLCQFWFLIESWRGFFFLIWSVVILGYSDNRNSTFLSHLSVLSVQWRTRVLINALMRRSLHLPEGGNVQPSRVPIIFFLVSLAIERESVCRTPCHIVQMPSM